MHRRTLSGCLFLMAVVAVGCGDDGDGGAADATGERRGEGISFQLANTGPVDVGHLSVLEAMERMEEEHGYETESLSIAETESVADGVIRQEFEFGLDTTPLLVAFEAGAAEAELVGVRNPNGWAIVAQSDIESCDDLDGKIFAIHSEGSVMAAIYRQWAGEACSGEVGAEEIVISGSPNRTAALIAGQIDATAVELQDLATLNEEYSGKFNIVSPQWEENPDLVSNGLFVNAEWAAEHSRAVTDLLYYMTQVAREWAEDPSAFEAEIRKELPDLDDADIEFFIEEIGVSGLYATNGGVTEEAMDATIDFFTEAGAIEGTVTTEDVLNLAYLEEALGELDVELSTESDVGE